jgi:hypothetical protein
MNTGMPQRVRGEVVGAVDTLADALSYIEGLASDEFFGMCELIFERGRVVLVRTTRTLKPQELAGRGHREAGNGKSPE